MCQAIPREVIGVEVDRAEVLIDGCRTWVRTQAMPDLRTGEYVVIYAGQVLERMEREQAELVLQEMAELDAMFDTLMPEEALN